MASSPLTADPSVTASQNALAPSNQEAPALQLLLADLTRMSSSDLQAAWKKGIALGVLSMAQSLRHE
jgi:hypothetical protein